MWAGIAIVSRALGIGARFFRESDFTGMLLDDTFYGLNVGETWVCVHNVPMELYIFEVR